MTTDLLDNKSGVRVVLYIGFALFFPQQERSAKSHELNTKKRLVWVRGLPDLACGSQDEGTTYAGSRDARYELMIRRLISCNMICK